MGKNKSKSKNNVFKVAGAKSLKKTKTKPVNLGLKNIKKKIEDIDAQFVEISKTPKQTPTPQKTLPKSQKQKKDIPTKEEINKSLEKIVNMNI